MAIRSLDVGRVYDVISIMTGGGRQPHRVDLDVRVPAGVHRPQFRDGQRMSYVTVIISFIFTWYLFRNVIKSRWEGKE
jgi:hypothetical protein